jgi:hypothetical protein
LPSTNSFLTYLDKPDLDNVLVRKPDLSRLHRLLHLQSPRIVSGAHEDEATTALTSDGFVTKSKASVNDGNFEKLVKGLPKWTLTLEAGLDGV